MDDLHDEGEAGSEKPGFDRRDLLKKGAIGAGAAGVVWAAPKIEGLSLRPDYASAGTSGPGNDTPNIPSDLQFDHNSLSSGGPFTATSANETVNYNSNNIGPIQDGSTVDTTLSIISTTTPGTITSVNFNPFDDGSYGGTFTPNGSNAQWSVVDVDGAIMHVTMHFN